MTFVAKDLPADPDASGWVKGWAVFRNEPWLLAAVLASKADAKDEAAKLPESFEIKYGSHRLGSDDFVFSSLDND